MPQSALHSNLLNCGCQCCHCCCCCYFCCFYASARDTPSKWMHSDVGSLFHIWLLNAIPFIYACDFVVCLMLRQVRACLCVVHACIYVVECNSIALNSHWFTHWRHTMIRTECVCVHVNRYPQQIQMRQRRKTKFRQFKCWKNHTGLEHLNLMLHILKPPWIFI